MSALEPLSPEMIRRYLVEVDAAYEVDEDGDFVYQYGPEPDVGSFLTDRENPDQVDIFLDYTTVFKFGVSQEQFRYLTDEIVASAFDFWVLAHRNHGI